MKGTKREKKLAQTLIVMLCSVYARCFVYLRNVFTNHKNWHPHINCKICTVFCTDAFTYVCTHSEQMCRTASSHNRIVQAIKRCIVKWNKYAKCMNIIIIITHRWYCVIMKFWWSREQLKMTLVQFTGSTMDIWLKNYIFSARKLINGLQSI